MIVTRPEAHFLHLGVNSSWGRNSSIEIALIEEKLDKAKDWLRYAPDSWIIYTGKSAMHWASVIRSIHALEGKMTFFVCEVNIKEKAGLLHNAAWEWINKPRRAAP